MAGISIVKVGRLWRRSWPRGPEGPGRRQRRASGESSEWVWGPI